MEQNKTQINICSFNFWSRLNDELPRLIILINVLSLCNEDRLTNWLPSLWVETFEDLLDEQLDYEDDWSFQFNYSLTKELTAREKGRGWKISCQCSKAQFKCGSCGNSWFSARVTLLFHYRLRRGRGTVIMRPFGQSCRNCQDDNFYLPGFVPKTVEDILIKVFSKIRKNCYMENDDDNDPNTEPSTKSNNNTPTVAGAVGLPPLSVASSCPRCVRSQKGWLSGTAAGDVNDSWKIMPPDLFQFEGVRLVFK
ncbi:Receptor-transporting protein 3 [Oryzias melastigma]|uniref:Receptor-transporting protein 3 n=1 Tax=Oryzias melastigma TaxID=30732 RepID=A0A834FP75_ORYME|nr:Receptor-transporting protein 3 [Oryzias melastigma]